MSKEISNISGQEVPTAGDEETITSFSKPASVGATKPSVVKAKHSKRSTVEAKHSKRSVVNVKPTEALVSWRTSFKSNGGANKAARKIFGNQETVVTKNTAGGAAKIPLEKLPHFIGEMQSLLSTRHLTKLKGAKRKGCVSLDFLTITVTTCHGAKSAE